LLKENNEIIFGLLFAVGKSKTKDSTGMPEIVSQETGYIETGIV